MTLSFSLLPQENRFFDLLSESGELTYQSVVLLQDLVQTEDTERMLKLGHDIETVKNRAKEVTQEITQKLCQTFITPFDREDIQALANGFYQIPKICEKVQERILAFHLKPFQEDWRKLTQNMQEAATALHGLSANFKQLKDTEAVHQQCALLNQVENQNDKLLNELLVILFQGESDVKQVILRKDLYNLMEDIVDRHRDMGNLILQIVLKHA